MTETLTDSRMSRLIDDIVAQRELSDSVVRKLRESKPKVSLSESPTRSERLNQTPKSLPDKIPDWARTMTCPRCSGLMTIIKGKADTAHGDSLTLQCHNSFQSAACLLIIDVTTSSPYKMKAGDFLIGDISWKEVAPETTVAVGLEIPVDPFPYKVAPASPWIKTTVRSGMYRVFWRLFMKNKSVNLSELMKTFAEENPQYKDNPGDVVGKAMDSLPHWIEDHTGFKFKLVENNYVLLGRGKGNPNFAPFSSAKYRTDYGF